jgi:hypothetical protein
METFALGRSVFFRSIYNGSPFRTFPYRGWNVSCHILNVAQHLKELFSLCVRFGILLHWCLVFWFQCIKFIRRKCLVSRHQDVPHPDTIFTFHFPSTSCGVVFFFREGGRRPAAGPQLTLTTQVQPKTLLTHVKIWCFRQTVTPNVLWCSEFNWIDFCPATAQIVFWVCSLDWIESTVLNVRISSLEPSTTAEFQRHSDSINLSGKLLSVL